MNLMVPIQFIISLSIFAASAWGGPKMQDVFKKPLSALTKNYRSKKTVFTSPSEVWRVVTPKNPETESTEKLFVLSKSADSNSVRQYEVTINTSSAEFPTLFSAIRRLNTSPPQFEWIEKIKNRNALKTTKYSVAEANGQLTRKVDEVKVNYVARSRDALFRPNVAAKLSTDNSGKGSRSVNLEFSSSQYEGVRKVAIELPDYDKGYITNYKLLVNTPTQADPTLPAQFDLEIWTSTGRAHSYPFEVHALPSRNNRAEMEPNEVYNVQPKMVNVRALTDKEIEELTVLSETFQPQTSSLKSKDLIIKGLKQTK